MATIISTPGGRRASSIAPAPSYAGVVSKYANDIASALADQTVNNVNKLVLDWQSGALGWEDFLRQYTDIMNAQPDGSALATKMGTSLLSYQTQHRDDLVNQKRSELTAQYAAGGNLSQTDQYNIERQLLTFYQPGTEDYNKQLDNVTGLYSKAIQEKVDNTRAQLLDKYSGGGVTPQEQLNIVNQLLTIAPVGTDTYNSLIGERAQIQTNIANASSSENTQKASQAFEFAQYQEQNDITPNYQAGRLDGLTADQQNLDNWKNVQILMQGLKSQVEGKTIAYVNAKVADLQKQVDLRNQGRVFDSVITQTNGSQVVAPVNVNDIVAGRNTGAITPKIVYDAQGDVFKVFDPRTGSYVAQATNEADAKRQAAALGVPGVLTVKTPNGDTNYYYDTNKDSTTYNQFIKIDPATGKPMAAYPTIPITPTQEKFKVPIGTEQISQTVNKGMPGAKEILGEASKAFTNPKGFFNDVGAGIKSTFGLNQPAPQGNLLERAGAAAKTAFNMSPTGMLLNPVINLFKGLTAGGNQKDIPIRNSNIPQTVAAGNTTQPRISLNPFAQLGQTISTDYNKASNFIKGLFAPKS